jgi:hypothetical protein
MAIQVPIDTISSNFSKLLLFCGIADIPEFIKSKVFDNYLFLGVLVLICIQHIILPFYNYRCKKKKSKELINISAISKEIIEMSREALEIHKKNDPRVAKSYEILLNQFCSHMIALDKRLPPFGERYWTERSYVTFLKDYYNDFKWIEAVGNISDWSVCSKGHVALSYFKTTDMIAKMKIAISILRAFFSQESIETLQKIVAEINERLNKCEIVMRNNINKEFDFFSNDLFEAFNKIHMIDLINKIMQLSSNEFRHDRSMVYALSDEFNEKK